MKVVKKTAEPMNSLVLRVITATGLKASHNKYRIDLAWMQTSGAGEYTRNIYFRGGTLYISLNSSVVRSMLAVQNAALLAKLNAALCEDELFIKKDGDKQPIRKLVLK